VALRGLSDESRVRLETAQILDLNDGTRTRILRKVTAGGAAPPGPNAPARPMGPSVEIFRGGKDGATSTVYGVPAR
jgi:pilus assembly protein CpaB